MTAAAGHLLQRIPVRSSKSTFLFCASGIFDVVYENEPDVVGKGSAIDFGARVYDSRLGKFFSTDPLIFASWSPYQYDANCPIFIVDMFGMGPSKAFTKEQSANGGTIYVASDAIKTYAAGGIGTDDGGSGQSDILTQFTLMSGETFKATYSEDGSYLGYQSQTTGDFYCGEAVERRNFVFVASPALIAKDKEAHDGNSAYAYDKDVFASLSSKSNGNFILIEVDDLEDMTEKIKQFCDLNVVEIDNVIIDFHGTSNNFKIGITKLRGLEMNKHRSNFETICIYMSGNTKILMGNCNVGKWHR